jgi:shikimate kinase
MEVKLFVLGLPGSGKSSIARFISTYMRDYQWLVYRFNDYTFLEDMYRQDTARKRFKDAELGGFDVLDLKVFDEALQTLEPEVREHIDALEPDIKELVLIEFSRNNYELAFCQFNKSFLKDAYVLYLGAEIEVCKHRIRHRIDNPQFEEDDFNVSNYIFEEYYREDDGARIADVLENYGVDRQHVWAIDNSCSYETACMKVEPFIQQILKAISQKEEADNPKASLEGSVSEIDSNSPRTSLDESVPIKQAEGESLEATSEKQLADISSRS